MRACSPTVNKKYLSNQKYFKIVFYAIVFKRYHLEVELHKSSKIGLSFRFFTIIQVSTMYIQGDEYHIEQLERTCIMERIRKALLMIIVPLQSLYRQMLWFFFVPAFEYKIYSLMLYHLLKRTLHSKANACSIGTFIRFYSQMRVQKN